MQDYTKVFEEFVDKMRKLFLLWYPDIDYDIENDLLTSYKINDIYN